MGDAATDPLTRFRLDGRVALVPGGTGGIGLGIAAALAAAGAHVAIASRSGERARAAVGTLGDGVRTLAIEADMNVIGDADRAVDETVQGLGGLDVLVNSVGGGA